MKLCPKCQQIKPLSEFHKNRGHKDGLQYRCKSCVKAYSQTSNGKIVIRKAVARYHKTSKGKAVQSKAFAKWQKTPKGKAAIKRYNDRHPNYIKATNAVNNAIKADKLPRADTRLCYYCPKPAQEYHHWHGYEPECWMNVVPICIKCHKKEHRKIA